MMLTEPQTPKVHTQEPRRAAQTPDLRFVSAGAAMTPTWGERVEDFLRRSPNLRDSTRAAYCSDLRIAGQYFASEFEITNPGDVTPYHVRAFATSQAERAVSTIRRRLDALSTFFAFLLDMPNPPITRNPVTKGTRPKRKPKPPREAMPTEHFEALRSATRGPLEGAVFEVLAGMGLRGGEALALGVKDFEGERPAVWIVGKSQRAREVPVNETVREAVAAWTAERPPLTTNALFVRHGVPLTPKVLRTMFRRWTRRAGLLGQGYTPHDLRHHFATQLLLHGNDLETIAELMGHESVATLSIYLHSSGERKRAAVDSLRGQGVTGHTSAQVGEGQRQVDRRRGRVSVPEHALDAVQVAAAPQQERRAGVSEAVGRRPWAVQTGAGQRPS